MGPCSCDRHGYPGRRTHRIPQPSEPRHGRTIGTWSACSTCSSLLLSLAWTDQGEGRALRIEPVEGIFATRNFDRSMQDLPAAGADRLRRLADVGDADVMVPDGVRHVRGRLHHRANPDAVMLDQ